MTRLERRLVVVLRAMQKAADEIAVEFIQQQEAEEERTIMSYRTKNGVPVIKAEADDVCDLCGKVAELRPYGPKGENICYECGMKNEAVTNKMLGRVLFGDPEHLQ